MDHACDGGVVPQRLVGWPGGDPQTEGHRAGDIVRLSADPGSVPAGNYDHTHRADRVGARLKRLNFRSYLN